MRDVGALHPVADADPPIQLHETDYAPVALCPRHGSRYQAMNMAGAVYFCPHPRGLMYWRAKLPGEGLHAPLKFARNM